MEHIGKKISKEALEEYCDENMFYVFVLKAENRVDYLVLPSTFIHKNLGKFDIDSNGWIHFYLEFKNRRVIETRKSNIDLTYYLNNFKPFKP